MGRGLAGDARRPGDYAVHLLPAVRRPRSRSHLRRAHVWTRAHRRFSAGCGLDLRYRLGARSGEVRHAEELQFSVYNFESADVAKLWQHFNEYEAEAKGLLAQAEALLGNEAASATEKKRFPLLPTY